jgi:hypothetical protein
MLLLHSRGYYIRAKIVDYVLRSFISTYGSTRNQIVNLGCGFDSTYYRLKNNGLLDNTLFIEIDFPDVVNRKFNMINAHKELFDLCPDLAKKTSVNDNVGMKALLFVVNLCRNSLFFKFILVNRVIMHLLV